MSSEATGDWIRTFTGKRFFVLNPRPEDVCIEDIAHALSMLCRYTGHVQRFYSVAEHSLYVTGEVAARLHAAGRAGNVENQNILRWALLHDASEAYTGDLTRPLKHQAELTLFREVEARIMLAIRTQFGLIGEEPALVREVDREIIGSEARQLKFGEGLATVDPLPPMFPGLRAGKMGVGPAEAEEQFLIMWRHLERDKPWAQDLRWTARGGDA